MSVDSATPGWKWLIVLRRHIAEHLNSLGSDLAGTSPAAIERERESRDRK